MKTRKHICEWKRSKPTASVDTCYCGKFRHHENNTSPAIVERPQHTPTPWRVEPLQADHGASIAIVAKAFAIAIIPPINAANEPDMDDAKRDPHDEANAAFIVRAVNSHEELVAVVKNLITCMNAEPHEFHSAFVAQATNALSRAKGKE